MELKLVEGRPLNPEGRLEKEIKTYDLLDSLGIFYERADHEEANTMEACLEIDKVLAPAVICKNLFLCNAQKTKFYLLMIREDKKFKTKEISHQINSSRLSFAPSDYMQQFLNQCDLEDVSEALLAIEDMKHVLEAEYHRINSQISFRGLPAGVDGRKLQKMMDLTVRGLLQEQFREGTFQPEMLYDEIVEYVDMMKKMARR